MIVTPLGHDPIAALNSSALIAMLISAPIAHSAIASD
jgi:hypothetical protein